MAVSDLVNLSGLMEAVRADLGDIGIAFGANFGHPPLFDPLVVALVPCGRCERAQPVRGEGGDVVQRRT